jgi:hypothetical protein
MVLIFYLRFLILTVLTITLFDLWLTLSDYPLVSWKFWPLHCLIFDLRFLITLWYLETFGHYIVWSLTYAFWLSFGILKVFTITLFDLWLTLSDYPLVSWNFWPLHCLIFDLRFLITLWYLESFHHYIVLKLSRYRRIIRKRKSKIKQCNGENFQDTKE